MKPTMDTVKAMAYECGTLQRFSKKHLEQIAERLELGLKYSSLYDETWHEGKAPFILENVVRQGPPADIDEFPNEIWGFREGLAMEDVFASTSARPFVRDEYPIALRYIMAAKVRGGQILAESYSDLEYGPDFKSKDVTMDSTSEGQPSQAGQKEKEPVTGDKPGVGSTDFANPFMENDDTGGALEGISVLGQPGIGKTTFLYYVLLLRLQAKKPTMLVENSQFAILFLSQGVFEVNLSHLASVKTIIPPTTWCLVDSNQDIEDVPEAVVKSSLFVVQAAALQYTSKSTAWNERKYNVWQYWMNPSTLPEIIIGWDRIWPRPGMIVENYETKLEEFYWNYTASARTAYFYLVYPDRYKKEIDNIFRLMNMESVEKSSTGFMLSVGNDNLCWDHINNFIPTSRRCDWECETREPLCRRMLSKLTEPSASSMLGRTGMSGFQNSLGSGMSSRSRLSTLF